MSQRVIKKLEVGDVILQPLNCYLCNLIEVEERSIFSHVGIVIEKTFEKNGSKVLIAEAYGEKVAKVELSQFLKKTQENQTELVLRPREFGSLKRDSLQKIAKKIQSVFEKSFKGKSYDPEFLLNNDKYYCSELVMDLLNHVLKNKILTKPMHYLENRTAWEAYFEKIGSQVPDSLPGISPGDLERLGLFQTVPL